MARPKKKDADKLTVFLPPVRCAVAEKKSIDGYLEKHGLKYSDFARQAMLGYIANDAPKAANDSPFTPFQAAIIDALHRIGNNLNQLVKKFHGTGREPKALRPALASLEKILNRIFEHINLES